jgi:uncharacterized cofD-like protein
MKNKNIVTIGGGTGSFTLLSGLKKYPVNISAIVSVADDGGSTGVLRDELGVLPPGDARQCLVALSDSTDILRQLMGYRFEEGSLAGHNFGNLLLSALEKIRGNFALGVEEAAKILKIKGEVIPVTDKNVKLQIELRNRKILSGQFQLDQNEELRRIGLKRIFLKSKVEAYRKAIDRIKNADHIIIGPGDFYGSIIPNFLVSGIRESIRRSEAKVIFILNLTNKKGQTENYDLSRYVEILEGYIGKGRINIVVENNKQPDIHLVRKYERREGKGSIVKVEGGIEAGGIKIISADLIQKKSVKFKKADRISKTRSFIRHDSEKLARTIIKIISE